MPKAASEILSSPSSVNLGVLVRSKSSNAVAAMSGLLLGLCLDYIAEKGSSNSLTNAENSAWTKDTIVNMIQSIGVSRYFNMLDEWKKKPFPLPYCAGSKRPVLESRAASLWYSECLTQVRRRVVSTIAGESGDNEYDSDGDDGAESNASSRSLRKMVKSQALEMEELQSKLDEAMQTIASQSSQIKSLKRVAELGITAETNDMLSEYQEKIAELETEKVKLVNEAEQKFTLQKDELCAKEQEISSLQEDLRQARIAAEESERDKEALSEEMAGLSDAYNSLEQEYRSNRSNSVSEVKEMTAGGETAAEDPTRANDQLVALQDENSRLKEDVRAANEWMAMAVSKMDEMGRENEALSISLQEAQNNTTVLPSFLKQKDEELAQQKTTIEELQGRNEEAQQWMDSAVARLDALTNEVERLKSRNAELEGATSNQETAQSELENIKAQNDTLTAECQTLQGNLAEFQSWTETAQARIAEMEATLLAVTEERDQLRNTLRVSSDDANKQVQLLQADLNKKSDELIEARAQLEQIQSQLIEESDANEAVVENIRNELGQQQHAMENLISEKDELLAASTSRLSELEAALQEMTIERDELTQSLQSSGNNDQVEVLRSELKAKEDELEDARSQLEQVQSQLIEESDANEEVVERLRNELEAEKQVMESLASEKDELVVRLTSTEAQFNTVTAENEILYAQIQQLNQSIAELESAKKAAESHSDELMQLSSPEASKLEDEIIALTADRNEIKAHFDDLTEEYEQTKQTLERIQVSTKLCTMYVCIARRALTWFSTLHRWRMAIFWQGIEPWSRITNLSNISLQKPHLNLLNFRSYSPVLPSWRNQLNYPKKRKLRCRRH
jgi:chromosome segregation ATPase